MDARCRSTALRRRALPTRIRTAVAGITSPAFPGVSRYVGSNQAWFVSAAYRVDVPNNPAAPAANHIYDQTVTARFDLKRWWNVKIEGHFMDDYGDVHSAHGFYTRSGWWF